MTINWCNMVKQGINMDCVHDESEGGRLNSSQNLRVDDFVYLIKIENS